MKKKMLLRDYIDQTYTCRKPDLRTVRSRIDKGQIEDINDYFYEGRICYVWVKPIYDDPLTYEIFAKNGSV